jgi:hypothetical protein
MKKPHIRADIIKAWADGAEIEVYEDHFDVWTPTSRPAWLPEMVYRVKTEPKQKPHIHADIIKAWSDGAEIQSKFDEPEEMYYGQNSWSLEPFPDWDPLVLYRVIKTAL